jgi:MFS family permease
VSVPATLRIRPDEPAADSGGKGSVTAGARFIAGNRIVRWSLIAVATVNFFNLMFAALYVLYAVSVLRIGPGVLGVVIGIGAVGGVVASLVTKRVAARIGIGRAYTVGCLVFTVPLVLWPLAGGPRALVLVMLLVAEFGCGFGVMMLDISIAAIFSAVIPDTLRSRVTGAFSAVNYGTRPLGALLGACWRPGSGCGPRCGSRPRAGWSALACCCRRPCPGTGCLPFSELCGAGLLRGRRRTVSRPGSSSTRFPR